MVSQLLNISKSTRSAPWELVQRKNRISIYRTNDESYIDSPCNTHAESTAYGELEDIARWNVISTTDSFNEVMQLISADFVEGKILANLLSPTKSDPYKSIGLRWASFKTTIPAERDYQMILLESSNFIVDKSGQSVACCTLKSVNLSIINRTLCTRPDSHSLRTLPLTGFTFQSTEIPRNIKITYSCYFDTFRDFPTWAVNIGMQVEVEQRIQGRIRFLESCRAKEATALVTTTHKYNDDDKNYSSSRNLCAVRSVAPDPLLGDASVLETRKKSTAAEIKKGSRPTTTSDCFSTRPENRALLFEAITQSQKLIVEAAAANTLAQHARETFLKQFIENNSFDQNYQHFTEKQHGLITSCGSKLKKYSIDQPGSDCRRIPVQRGNNRVANIVLTRQEAF